MTADQARFLLELYGFLSREKIEKAYSNKVSQSQMILSLSPDQEERQRAMMAPRPRSASSQSTPFRQLGRPRESPARSRLSRLGGSAQRNPSIASKPAARLRMSVS